MKNFLKSLFQKDVMVDGSLIEVEQKFREIAVVHYREGEKSLSLDAEWLGWGKEQTPYLLVMLPEKPLLGNELLDDRRVMEVADRIHRGLTQKRILHVVEQDQPRISIPQEECDARLAEFQQQMAALGWQITVDKAAKRLSQRRVEATASTTPQDAANISQEIFRMGNYIRGYRTSRKVLRKSDGVEYKESL